MALISPYQHMASEKTSTCDHQVNALSQQPNPTPTAIIENLIQYIERSTPGHSPVDSRLLSFAKLEKPRPSLKVKPLSYMKWNTLQSSPVDSKSAHYVKRNTPPQSAASEKKAQNQVTLRIRHTSPIDASPLTQANLETQYSPVDLKALGYIDLWLESSTPESSPRDQKLPSKSPLQLFKPLPTPPDSPPTICVELEGSTPAPMRDPPSPDGSHIVNFAELEGCTPQFLQSLEQLHRTSLVELPDSPTSLYDPSPVESKFTGDSELPSFTTSIDPSPVEMEQKKLGNLAGPKYYSLPPPEATKPFCKEEVMRRSAPHIAHLLEQKQQRLTKTEDSVVECSKPEIQAIIIPPPAQAQRQIEQHKILYPETKPLSPITESDKRRPEDLEVQHESQLSKAVAIQEHRRRYGREHGVRFKRGFFAGKKGIQMRMARRVTSMTKMEWVIENALGGDRLLKCFAQPNSLSRNRNFWDADGHHIFGFQRRTGSTRIAETPSGATLFVVKNASLNSSAHWTVNHSNGDNDAAAQWVAKGNQLMQIVTVTWGGFLVGRIKLEMMNRSHTYIVDIAPEMNYAIMAALVTVFDDLRVDEGFF